MAEIAVNPIFLEDCVMSIEDDDYAAAVSAATFTPTARQGFKGMKKNQQHRPPASWQLALSLAQDLATLTSLSNYLHVHEGETKAAVFKPVSGTGPEVQASIVIFPGGIGGTVETVPTSSVTMDVLGKPEIVPAV